MKPELTEMTIEHTGDGLMRVNCTFFVGNFQIIMPEYFGTPKKNKFFEAECIKLIKKAAKEL